MLPEIIVHKMVYDKGYYGFDSSILQKYKFIDLSDDYTSEYIKIYNKCFYDMRRQLKVEPYDFYSSKVQLADKYSNIKLLY